MYWKREENSSVSIRQLARLLLPVICLLLSNGSMTVPPESLLPDNFPHEIPPGQLPPEFFSVLFRTIS